MTGLATKKLSFVLLWAVGVILLADAVATILAPLWLKIAYERGYGELHVFFGTPYNHAHPAGTYFVLLPFVLAVGALLACILWQAFSVLRRFLRESPFTRANARSFLRAGVFSFVVSVAFCGKMFYTPSILTLLCCGIFLLLGFFLLVLWSLFLQAAQLREENELTI